MPLPNHNQFDPALPASVCLEVRPNGQVSMMSIYQGQDRDRNLHLFMDRLLTATQEKNHYPDCWIFRYDLPPYSKILGVARKASGHFSTFRSAAQRAGISPTHVLSLHDIVYCQRYGIECLSPAGRRDRLSLDPDYRTFLSTLHNNDSTPSQYKSADNVLKTCRAVDVGSGLLLYDLRLTVGRDAYKSLMQFCADHFFSNRMEGMEKMSLYDVHCFFDQKFYISKIGAINLNFNHLRRDFSLNELDGRRLFNPEMRHEGFFVKEYDMRPLSTSFVEFINGEKVRTPIHSNSLDIALLDQIAREGYPRLRPAEELRTFSPYLSRFKDLETRIIDCEDEEQMTSLQKQAAQRAKEILDGDFPHRRKTPALVPEQDMDIIPSLEMRKNPSGPTRRI